MMGQYVEKLNVNYSTNLFMELIAGGEERDFQGQERQIFQSPTGNVTHDRIYLGDTVQTQLTI